MKVSELTGAQLDYWVAKAVEDLPSWFTRKQVQAIADAKKYSTNWSQGGLIIEREKMCPFWNGSFNFWSCYVPCSSNRYDGETPLIAAMRCYVASKYGEEVPDE